MQYFIPKLSHSRRVVSARDNGKWVPQYTLRRQHTKNKVAIFYPIKLSSIRLSDGKCRRRFCSARNNEVD